MTSAALQFAKRSVSSDLLSEYLLALLPEPYLLLIREACCFRPVGTALPKASYRMPIALLLRYPDAEQVARMIAAELHVDIRQQIFLPIFRNFDKAVQ